MAHGRLRIRRLGGQVPPGAPSKTRCLPGFPKGFLDSALLFVRPHFGPIPTIRRIKTGYILGRRTGRVGPPRQGWPGFFVAGRPAGGAVALYTRMSRLSRHPHSPVGTLQAQTRLRPPSPLKLALSDFFPVPVKLACLVCCDVLGLALAFANQRPRPCIRVGNGFLQLDEVQIGPFPVFFSRIACHRALYRIHNLSLESKGIVLGIDFPITQKLVGCEKFVIRLPLDHHNPVVGQRDGRYGKDQNSHYGSKKPLVGPVAERTAAEAFDA